MKKIMAAVLAAAMMVVLLCACNTGSVSSAKIKVVDIELSQESYAFAVSKSDKELMSNVNEYLAKIKGDGTFDAICDKYFGNGTPTKVESKALDTSKDQLVVATSTGFEPFEMVDSAGLFYGIDLEIAAGLASYLGKELVIQDMKFESVVTSVQTGICDIGMAGLTVTAKRQALVDFSDSYYNAAQMLIVRADDTTFDNCKTADDVVAILDKLTSANKIGCQAGTTGETYITGDLDQGDDGYGFKGIPVTKMAYDYAALAVTAMINGEIDYVVVDNAPAKAISKSVNGK